MSAGQRFPPRVRILYEDSRAATQGFGLHDFVLANVQDVLLEDDRERSRRHALVRPWLPLRVGASMLPLHGRVQLT